MEEARYRRRLWPMRALRAGAAGTARLEISGGRASLRVDARGLKGVARVRLMLLGAGRWVEAQRAPVEKGGEASLLLEGQPRAWPMPPEQVEAVALAEDGHAPTLLLEGGEAARSERERADARVRLLALLAPAPARQPAPREEARVPVQTEPASAALRAALTVPRRISARRQRQPEAQPTRPTPEGATLTPAVPVPPAAPPTAAAEETPRSAPAAALSGPLAEMTDARLATAASPEAARSAPAASALPAPASPAAIPPATVTSRGRLLPPPVEAPLRRAISPLPRGVRLPALEPEGLHRRADDSALRAAAPRQASTAARLPPPAKAARESSPVARNTLPDPTPAQPALAPLSVRHSPPRSPLAPPSRTLRPLCDLPRLHWPRELAALRPYFDTMEPFMPFDAPGWRFVRVPLAGGEKGYFALGVRVQNGRVTRLCYAVPGDNETPPPASLTGYRWQQGLAGVGYWTLWQGVDQRFHSASQSES